MGLFSYIAKRVSIYIVVFIVAVTIVWMLVRFAPGDPALTMVMRTMMAAGVRPTPEQIELMKKRAIEMLAWDKPLYEQYLIFWSKLLRGDLGITPYYGNVPVAQKLAEVISYDVILLVPAILVSWFLGNWIGAYAARHRMADRVIMTILYILTSIPYFLFGLVLVYLFGVVWNTGWVKVVIQSSDISNFLHNPNLQTFTEFLKAYTLPFLSLVVVMLGGWASGMRNLMVYELESNYARYMEMLGFSSNKVASYAFRYAINPQITGLGIQLGTVIVGGLVLSSVFSYPGAGLTLINAISYRDIFLIQGIAIYYTFMVILANLIIDVLYALIDPRIRIGMVMGGA